MEWIDLLVPLVTMVLGGLAGHFSGGRQARQSEARAARRGSALELRTALRELREVVRRWGTSPAVTDDDVRAALTEWNRVLDFHRHRVPNDLMRALASVKFAAGEVFGPTVLAYVLLSSRRLASLNGTTGGKTCWSTTRDTSWPSSADGRTGSPGQRRTLTTLTRGVANGSSCSVRARDGKYGR